MKRRIFILFLSIHIFAFLSFAEEAEIVLPSLTTYVPGSVEQKIVITNEEIKMAHFESFAELVERCGIQMLSYGAFGLESKPSIRGFTDETVRVVIDGICVNNAQYGTFDLSFINLDSVEKIEIIRGGFTEGVEDEEAVGGVIYISMKKAQPDNSFSAEIAAKTFFNYEQPLDSVFQKLAFAGQFGENTFINSSAAFNYANNRFLYKVDKLSSLCDGAFGGLVTAGKDGDLYWGKKGVFRSQENACVVDGHSSTFVTHYFGEGNYFSIGDLFYAGHKNTPGQVNSKNFGLLRDYNNNLSFSLWNPAVFDCFNLKNSVSWLSNSRFYKNDSGSENSRHFINSIKYTGSADFNSIAGGRVFQTVGLSADFTTLDSTNDGKHLQFSGVIKETSKIAAGGGWTFSFPLAFKFSVNDNKLNFAFVPKTGVAWENVFLRFSADVYRMVQFPNIDDLFWEGGGFHGNSNLRPESGWGADFGVALKNIQIGKKRGGSFLNCGFTIFSDYYKDKIRWANNTTENLSSAFYFGVDFNLSADFFNKFWTFAINGEYLYNRLLDKESKYTYGKRIMWTPDFVCNFSTALNFSLAKVSFSATYTGRRYTDNMNLYYLNPYVLVNLAVEGSAFGGKFVPYLKIDNLLNWQYQSVEGYAMPGISLTVGGRYVLK